MRKSNLIPGSPILSEAPAHGRTGLSSARRESAKLADCFMFGFLISAVAVRQDFRLSGIRPSVFSLALLILLVLSSLPVVAADDSSMSQKANQTIEDTKKAGQATMDDLWRRLDEARLKNRSPDEIIAWALMGILVGAVAAMLTSLKNPGKVGYLVSGLVGAFIGGIVVNLTKVDFGWGPVLIRYEELLFSLAGAMLIVLILKFTGLKRFM